MSEPSMLAVLDQKVSSLCNDFSDVRSSLKELTAAINRLALVEERQAQLTLTVERVFKALDRLEQRAEKDRGEIRIDLEKLDTRVVNLEISEPMQRQTSKWVIAAATGLITLMATVIVPRLASVLLGS